MFLGGFIMLNEKRCRVSQKKERMEIREIFSSNASSLCHREN